MLLGEKIRLLRQRRGLTQPDLSALLGVEQSWLSRIENDKVTPSSEILQKLLDIFEITLPQLLSDLDPIYLDTKLSSLSEVIDFRKTEKSTESNLRQRWILFSAAALGIGITLILVAYLEIAFTNTRYLYRSAGVIFFGEPDSLFEMPGEIYDELGLEWIMGSTAGDEQATLVSGSATQRPQKAEFLQYVFTRRDQAEFLSREDLGESVDRQAYVQLNARNIYGNMPQAARRVYKRNLLNDSGRMYGANIFLSILGIILAITGILGFIVEARLAKIRTD